jgi:hypothetical protein
MNEPRTREILRDALGEIAREGGDFGEMPEMAAALAELIRPYARPDFQCLMYPLPPTPPAVFDGVDGIARAWEDFASGFRSVKARLDRAEEGEDAMLLLVDTTYVTDHGGVEMTQPAALVVLLDSDRVASVQFHLDQEAAFRAGGL